MQMCDSQWFLPSELQDNAHFYPHYVILRFDLNVGWSLQSVIVYSLVIKL